MHDTKSEPQKTVVGRRQRRAMTPHIEAQCKDAIGVKGPDGMKHFINGGYTGVRGPEGKYNLWYKGVQVGTLEGKSQKFWPLITE